MYILSSVQSVIVCFNSLIHRITLTVPISSGTLLDTYRTTRQNCLQVSGIALTDYLANIYSMYLSLILLYGM